ncbi:MAG: tetratricopeptide repeat protein [Gallionellaceae bacterium]
MKILAILIIAVTASFSSTSVLAENAAWQNSYKLETAGKYADAITALNKIPANGPDAEFKTLRRGWLFYSLGRYDESIKEYRFAIERNSKSIDSRLGVTLPLLAAKRWREASQNARAALLLSPNNYTALLRQTLALEGLKKWNEMSQVASLMVTSYPTDATAYIYLARAKAWQSKVSEAVAAYRAALVRYPGHLEAQAYLAKNQ